VASGRVVERLPNPDRLGSLLLAVAPDGPRVISRRARPVGGGPPALEWWDLSQKPPRGQPIHLRIDEQPLFSPDGSRLLSRDPGGDWILRDGHTLQIIAADTASGAAGLGFVDSNYFWLTAISMKPPVDLVVIRSATTGKLSRSVYIVPNSPSPFRNPPHTISDDMELVAGIAYGSPGALAAAVCIWEVSSGRLIQSHVVGNQWPMSFFPHSHRLLAGDQATSHPAIIDPSHQQPLAILPTPPGASMMPTPLISPDGQTIVTAADPVGRSLAIFRQTGWDCPESHLGALVFPQTWLTVALFAALCISLARDARRARPASVHRPPSSVVTTGLLLIAVVLTLYFLLTAALGRWTLTPAPLLLLAAMGLFTHSRAWRAITLWLMAGMLPLSLLLGYRIYRSGVWSASVRPVLDRYYSIPHLAPFVGLCAAAVVLPIGIFFLSRPRRFGG